MMRTFRKTLSIHEWLPLMQQFRGAQGFLDGRSYICCGMDFDAPSDCRIRLEEGSAFMRIIGDDGKVQSFRLHRSENFAELLAGATELLPT